MIYSTKAHPLGLGGWPDYEIKSDKLFRTHSHPDGWSGFPDYVNE